MRIQNVTTGCWIRFTRAERAIRERAAEWVEYGKTIRNLTLAESIQARIEDARRREPLPFAEIPGLKFDFARAAVAQERKLAWEASVFAATGEMSVA